MNEPIVSRAEIERRAVDAYSRGLDLDACPFNWHTAAYATWVDVYAALDAAAASPQSHVERTARQRVEQEQAA